ncbi:MAG: Caspase family protein, partial [Candidatus Poribacteria bacterium]|nr:Caspase family protein [Candidatus Poribacteria bacterium]
MLITLMRFVIYFIVCMFTVTSAYAQTQEKGFISKNTNDLALSIGLTQGTRWALLIGITNYPSSQTFD